MEGWAFPFALEQQGNRDLQILGLTFVKDVDESVELVGFEVNICRHLLVKLGKTFEHFQPVKVAKVLAEGPSEVGSVRVPLDRGLVNLFFL